MNSLVLSVLVAVVLIFHKTMAHYMRKGNVKTAFCALWCVDAIFSVVGIVISFILYRYAFHPFLTLRNGILVMVYLSITVLFIWASPSGFALITRRHIPTKKELLTAEYRLNDTLGIVRNCFLILLFCLPVFFSVVKEGMRFEYLDSWKEVEICGGFCFVAFLILVPVCLRQAIFWVRNLADTEFEEEERLLKKYYMQLRYRKRNRSL